MLSQPSDGCQQRHPHIKGGNTMHPHNTRPTQCVPLLRRRLHPSCSVDRVHRGSGEEGTGALCNPSPGAPWEGRQRRGPLRGPLQAPPTCTPHTPYLCPLFRLVLDAVAIIPWCACAQGCKTCVDLWVQVVQPYEGLYHLDPRINHLTAGSYPHFATHPRTHPPLSRPPHTHRVCWWLWSGGVCMCLRLRAVPRSCGWP